MLTLRHLLFSSILTGIFLFFEKETTMMLNVVILARNNTVCACFSTKSRENWTLRIRRKIIADAEE